MSPAAGGAVARHTRLIVAARLSMLALALTLDVFAPGLPVVPAQLVALVAVAIGFSAIERRVDRLPGRWPALLAIVEAVLAALVIGAQSPLHEALLPYLLAPALAAGLRGTWRSALAAAVAPALILGLAPLALGEDLPGTDHLASVSMWSALALATGLLGAWTRRVEDDAARGTRTYAEVNRLLLQLRDAARHLPGSLDEVTIAQSLLQELRDTSRFSRGGVAAVSEGGRLVPLARIGGVIDDLSVELDDSTPWGRAWRTHEPASAASTLGGDGHAFCLVLPVVVGERLVALVGLERTEAHFGAVEIARCAAVADAAGAGLDTASLFAEVRTIATAEERRRLAREIHDGIAQELASLGYVVDDLMSRPANEPTRPSDLRTLRRELTRVVTELRLSIFDLRSEVRPDTGVGEALSTYVRSVGAGSDLTVHLVLDEPRGRLRVEAEAELLRIAQEAITNARKHAGASNLWVTCRVDPPHAVLRIEDDGAGLGPRRVDSYGLDIMRERAARIGGVVHVGERPGGGTLVEVIVGQPRVGTRAGDAELTAAPQRLTAARGSGGRPTALNGSTPLPTTPEQNRSTQEGATRVHDGPAR